MKGKQLGSLINMVSKSKALLPLLFAGVGFNKLTHANLKNEDDFVFPSDGLFPVMDSKSLDGKKVVKTQIKIDSEGNKVASHAFDTPREDYKKIFGDEITISPVDEKHKKTMIWLPGLGDSADGNESHFNDGFTTPMDRYTRVRLLTAPTAKVTIQNGTETTSWFDLRSLRVWSHDAYDIDDVERNAKLIKQVIDEEVDRLDGNSEKVYIGGFSQGAAMALHVGLGYDKPLGGIIACSGFKIHETKISGPNYSTPVFVSHGTRDHTITFESAKSTYRHDNWIKRPNVKFHPCPNMGHLVNVKVLYLFRDFIKNPPVKFTSNMKYQ